MGVVVFVPRDEMPTDEIVVAATPTAEERYDAALDQALRPPPDAWPAGILHDRGSPPRSQDPTNTQCGDRHLYSQNHIEKATATRAWSSEGVGLSSTYAASIHVAVTVTPSSESSLAQVRSFESAQAQQCLAEVYAELAYTERGMRPPEDLEPSPMEPVVWDVPAPGVTHRLRVQTSGGECVEDLGRFAVGRYKVLVEVCNVGDEPMPEAYMSQIVTAYVKQVQALPQDLG